MDDSELSQLERLIALAEEAEQILSQSIASHDIRHACAVARGYLDLARHYNEPVNVDDVERVLAKMRASLCASGDISSAGLPTDPRNWQPWLKFPPGQIPPA